MNYNRYQDVLEHPERWLEDRQRRWLRPRSSLAQIAHALWYVVNWVLIRFLFRLSVVGGKHLPASGPFIIAPNHASPLDPLILGAALPLSLLQQTYCAGKQSTVLRNRLRRFLSWLTRVIPIDEDFTALAPAVTILEQGDNLVWFPEGRRSLDGNLQKFKPGIAILLTRCDVPVVPVFIHGAYVAFPPNAWLPRLRTRIEVRIGPCQSAKQLGLTRPATEDIRCATETLRQHVLQLRDK
ncbi:MAG: 1-acyl-sn-glycerol-3-phosphate acyltransferase [Planctomycetaceae bacterium]|nr:1-acyl-sn-glycerol-3-phosphate acyltransferase [Planctomycetaceae bacterium]